MTGIGNVLLFHLFVVYVVGYIAHTIIVALLKIIASGGGDSSKNPIPQNLEMFITWFASCFVVIGMYWYEQRTNDGFGAFIPPIVFAVTLVYMDYRQLNHQHIEMREVKANLFGVLCGFAIAGAWYWFG